MRMQFSKFAYAAGFALALTFGCTFDVETPPPQEPGGSNSSAGEPKYCIYPQEKLCILYIGTQNDCPSGGILSNACPYGSSSTKASSSSVAVPSSSVRLLW
ncbi:hypothetical protein R83H12_02228 [Fibrobacteria bacterium R8-3-H12]